MEEMRYNEQPSVVPGYTVRALGGCVLDTGLGKSSYSCDTANCVAAGAIESPSGIIAGVVLGDTKTSQVLPANSARGYASFIAAVRQGSFDS